MKIKVRAWDAETERFIYSDKPEDDYFFEFGNDGKLRAYAIDEVPASYDEPAYGKSRELEKPQLYTGTKKVYEGDICTLSHPDHYYTFNGYIIWDNEQALFSLRTETFADIPLFEADGLKIIGNIYETPELIANTAQGG